MIAVLLAFSSCSQEYTPTEYTLTFDPANGNEVSEIKTSTLTLPEEPSKTGYKFDYWVDANGNVLSSSLVGTRVNKDCSFTAHYTLLDTTAFVTIGSTGGDGSESNPFASITEAISKTDTEAILISAGEYSEDITITEGRTITISGVSSTSKTAKTSEATTTINGTITIGARANVTIENISLSSATSKASLISSTSADITLTLKNVTLSAASDGRFIYVSEDTAPSAESSATSKTLKVSLYNVKGEIKGSIGRREGNGFFLLGSTSDVNQSSDDKATTYCPVLDLSITNTVIEDVQGIKNYVYPLYVSHFSKATIKIDQSRFTTETNHYSWIRCIGNADTSSTIDITNSYLKGYAAFYLADVENVTANISSSTLIGDNQNTGSSSGFSTIALQFPNTSSINVSKSKLSFNNTTNPGASTQGLAEIGYLQSGDTGNTINIKNCSIEFNNPPVSETDSREFYRVGNLDSSVNSINIDDATLDYILGTDYELKTPKPENPSDDSVTYIVKIQHN